MRLRSHLLVLSIATAAPIVALATVIAVVVVKQDIGAQAVPARRKS